MSKYLIFKRIISILLITAILSSITGCGDGGTGSVNIQTIQITDIESSGRQAGQPLIIRGTNFNSINNAAVVFDDKVEIPVSAVDLVNNKLTTYIPLLEGEKKFYVKTGNGNVSNSLSITIEKPTLPAGLMPETVINSINQDMQNITDNTKELIIIGNDMYGYNDEELKLIQEKLDEIKILFDGWGKSVSTDLPDEQRKLVASLFYNSGFYENTTKSSKMLSSQIQKLKDMKKNKNNSRNTKTSNLIELLRQDSAGQQTFLIASDVLSATIANLTTTADIIAIIASSVVLVTSGGTAAPAVLTALGELNDVKVVFKFLKALIDTFITSDLSKIYIKPENGLNVILEEPTPESEDGGGGWSARRLQELTTSGTYQSDGNGNKEIILLTPGEEYKFYYYGTFVSQGNLVTLADAGFNIALNATLSDYISEGLKPLEGASKEVKDAIKTFITQLFKKIANWSEFDKPFSKVSNIKPSYANMPIYPEIYVYFQQTLEELLGGDIGKFLVFLQNHHYINLGINRPYITDNNIATLNYDPYQNFSTIKGIKKGDTEMIIEGYRFLPDYIHLPGNNTISGSGYEFPVKITKKIPIQIVDEINSIISNNSNYIKFVNCTIKPETGFSPDENFTQIYTFKNTGYAALGSDYSLELISGPNMGAKTSIPLPSTVGLDQEFQISIDMKAPSKTGTTYTNEWQFFEMNNSGSHPRSERFYTTIKTKGEPENSVEYISQSVPDYTVISPTHNFTQTYTFKNKGILPLDNTCKLVFKSGDQMGGPSSVSLTSSYGFGQEFDISIPMTAPQQPGEYTGYWQLVDASDKELGPIVSTIIKSTADYTSMLTYQSDYPKLNLFQTTQMEVKIKNEGTKTWYKNEVHLGTNDPKDRGSHFSHPNYSTGLNPDWLSDNRVQMQEESVGPGQEATFKITITANGNPLREGTHREEFQLVKDGPGSFWFGDFSLYWDINVIEPIDYFFHWVSQSPHPVISKGGTKELTVKVKNLGKVAWDPAIIHLGTDRPKDRNCGFYTPGAGWISTNRIKMTNTSSVKTGEEATFTFTITGNPAQGTYPEYFRLVNDNGGPWFNEPDNVGLYWNITVGDAGNTEIEVE